MKTPEPASRHPETVVRQALGRPASPFQDLPARMLLVDVDRQRLWLMRDGVAIADFPISTAAAGVGGEAGSQRTPPGWHRIHARIGADQPLGAIFESRVATGEVWRGEARSEDLILSRILTLEGLEPGVNRGPGRDSLERYIYVHGTNHEGRLGGPASHGCVRMANADIAWLHDEVAEGDPLLVVGGEPGRLDLRAEGRFHYAGIGGSGMSALAQFQAMAGETVTGSDRAFDRGERSVQRAQLERLGVHIVPQDGSGVGGDCAAVVLSTAVESEVPDFAAARTRGVPTVHRSELLAHFVDSRRTIAIAGTSGKSTVVGMVFEILRAAGCHPSLITGGELVSLQREGLIGNAFNDPASQVLVIEADESDGSLVRYRPAVGVVLNLQKDHQEVDEVVRLFERFRAQCREGFVTGEGDELAPLAEGATVFGFGPRAGVRAEGLVLEPRGSRFTVSGMSFRLAVPGRHNVENALAAIAACRAIGVPLESMRGALESFAGIARRFQTLGEVRGIEVVDDFAHNPAKLRAAIETAKGRARRVLAVFQPHGYGPTRFLRLDLVEAFAAALGPEDRLWLLEIFYAGGTARRDLSSADIAAEVAARGVRAEFAASRADLVAWIAQEASPGDLVLVMGARDPSLTDLARALVEALGIPVETARGPLGQ